MQNNIFYDKDFRSKIRNLDEASLAQFLADSADDVDVKVVANTKSTTYFVMPTSQDGYDQLGSIQAGGFNTLGSTGSASSISTFGGTVGTFTTASSFGCAGE